MATRSRVITMSPLVFDQEDELDLDLDLDLWEVVNPSDGDYSDDSFSVESLSDDDVLSIEDSSPVLPSVISLPSQILPRADDVVLAADLDRDGHIDGDGDKLLRDEIEVAADLGWGQRRVVVCSRYSLGIRYGDLINRGARYGGNDEDHDGDYDDSYDLDDELVPRKVSAKLGRQRMRKLSKRAIAKKAFASKTSPYSHLKPGYVGGKHGLGMKFRC